MTQNSHHDRGGGRLGAPLIWIVTLLLVLIALGLIVSILKKPQHEQLRPPHGVERMR
jgi:hypothetical protein